MDLTLLGSLLVIMIFSGYQNFVSRIDPAQHADWPEWMAKTNFTGLKLKLMSSSIVAISAIQLLRAFVNVKNLTTHELAWDVGIHLVFVISGLLLALSDRVSEPQSGAGEYNRQCPFTCAFSIAIQQKDDSPRAVATSSPYCPMTETP